MNARDLENRECLTRVVAHVLGAADRHDFEATKVDLAWDLRHFSLYSAENTRAILVTAAARMGFPLGTPEQIDRLATLLYRLSREDCSSVSKLNKEIRRLESTINPGERQ